MIYFFEMLDSGEVKIGYSGKSPEERLIQATTWTRVRALLVLPDGTLKDEKRWHRDFAHLRTTGERFTLTDELRGLLVVLTGGFDWDAELRRRSLEAKRLYVAKPEVREAMRLRAATPERREARRLYDATPEAREAQRLRNTMPEYREAHRLYDTKPEYREAQRLRNAKPENREADRLRNATPKAREAQRLRAAKPERREARRLRDANRRMLTAEK